MLTAILRGFLMGAALTAVMIVPMPAQPEPPRLCESYRVKSGPLSPGECRLV
jgi:hypothetical protein